MAAFHTQYDGPAHPGAGYVAAEARLDRHDAETMCRNTGPRFHLLAIHCVFNITGNQPSSYL